MGILRSVIGTIGISVKAVKTGFDKSVKYVVSAADEAEKERAAKHAEKEHKKNVILKKKESILRRVNADTKIAELREIVASLDDLDDEEDETPAKTSVKKSQ